MGVALDRLDRSLSGMIRTMETLTEGGVLLRSLREGIDYASSCTGGPPPCTSPRTGPPPPTETARSARS